jgi:hypothetical protein
VGSCKEERICIVGHHEPLVTSQGPPSEGPVVKTVAAAKLLTFTKLAALMPSPHVDPQISPYGISGSRVLTVNPARLLAPCSL